MIKKRLYKILFLPLVFLFVNSHAMYKPQKKEQQYQNVIRTQNEQEQNKNNEFSDKEESKQKLLFNQEQINTTNLGAIEKRDKRSYSQTPRSNPMSAYKSPGQKNLRSPIDSSKFSSQASSQPKKVEVAISAYKSPEQNSSGSSSYKVKGESSQKSQSRQGNSFDSKNFNPLLLYSQEPSSQHRYQPIANASLHQSNIIRDPLRSSSVDRSSADSKAFSSEFTAEIANKHQFINLQELSKHEQDQRLHKFNEWRQNKSTSTNQPNPVSSLSFYQSTPPSNFKQSADSTVTFSISPTSNQSYINKNTQDQRKNMRKQENKDSVNPSQIDTSSYDKHNKSGSKCNNKKSDQSQKESFQSQNNYKQNKEGEQYNQNQQMMTLSTQGMQMISEEEEINNDHNDIIYIQQTPPHSGQSIAQNALFDNNNSLNVVYTIPEKNTNAERENPNFKRYCEIKLTPLQWKVLFIFIIFVIITIAILILSYGL